MLPKRISKSTTKRVSDPSKKREKWGDIWEGQRKYPTEGPASAHYDGFERRTGPITGISGAGDEFMTNPHPTTTRRKSPERTKRDRKN